MISRRDFQDLQPELKYYSRQMPFFLQHMVKFERDAKMEYSKRR